MNGLASNGAVAAYAKLIGSSASAEFLMERCPLKKHTLPPQEQNTTKNPHNNNNKIQESSLVDKDFGWCCGGD